MRALLIRAFGDQARSWTISYDSRNKPLLTSPAGDEPAQISIAHSHGLVACAISDLGAIGIDVEYCARRASAQIIAASTFGEAEQAAIRRDGLAAFYKIWTLREAMAKASGRGFFGLPTHYDLFALAPTGKHWSIDLEQQSWTFYYQRLLRNYALSIALKH